jgi:hypothetical protein
MDLAAMTGFKVMLIEVEMRLGTHLGREGRETGVPDVP